MVAEAGASVRVERFTGQLGMFNRHHLEVHLRCLLVRKRAGLPPHECLVSEDAGFLGGLSPSSRSSTRLSRRHGYGSCSRSRTTGTAPCCPSLRAARTARCSASRCLDTCSGRMAIGSCTRIAPTSRGWWSTTIAWWSTPVPIESKAGHVVLCTNGFVDHVVEDAAGSPIRLSGDQRITGRTGHMTAFADAPRPPRR